MSGYPVPRLVCNYKLYIYISFVRVSTHTAVEYWDWMGQFQHILPRMDPQNEGLENGVPFFNGVIFAGSMLVFQGVRCFNPQLWFPFCSSKWRRQWPGHQDLSSCRMSRLMCWLERQKLSPSLHPLHLISCWLAVLLGAHLVVLRCLGGLCFFQPHMFPVHRGDPQNDMSNIEF